MFVLIQSEGLDRLNSFKVRKLIVVTLDFVF